MLRHSSLDFLSFDDKRHIVRESLDECNFSQVKKEKRLTHKIAHLLKAPILEWEAPPSEFTAVWREVVPRSHCDPLLRRTLREISHKFCFLEGDPPRWNYFNHLVGREKNHLVLQSGHFPKKNSINNVIAKLTTKNVQYLPRVASKLPWVACKADPIKKSIRFFKIIKMSLCPLLFFFFF